MKDSFSLNFFFSIFLISIISFAKCFAAIHYLFSFVVETSPAICMLIMIRLVMVKRGVPMFLLKRLNKGINYVHLLYRKMIMGSLKSRFSEMEYVT